MSDRDPRRFSRQTRLPEIGAAGQARLASASIALRSAGLARVVEERYVRASGLRVDDEHPTIDPARVDLADVAVLGLRHPAARDVAEGSLRALVALRAALSEPKGSA